MPVSPLDDPFYMANNKINLIILAGNQTKFDLVQDSYSKNFTASASCNALSPEVYITQQGYTDVSPYFNLMILEVMMVLFLCISVLILQPPVTHKGFEPLDDESLPRPADKKFVSAENETTSDAEAADESTWTVHTESNSLKLEL